MTRGLGNRALSFFDSSLSNFTCLQREFSKTHACVQIDRWSLRETFHLRFCHPGIPNFPSTSISSITVERHRC